MYRDARPTCLSCDAALAGAASRWACEQCGSALVSEAALTEMLAEMAPADERTLDARLLAATSPSRRCPRCAAMMSSFILHDTLVDRCAAHGVWFDPGELKAVLRLCANRAQERAMAGDGGVIVGLLGSYLGLELLWFGVAVAVPAFAAAAAGLTSSLVKRWRRRHAVVPPGR